VSALPCPRPDPAVTVHEQLEATYARYFELWESIGVDRAEWNATDSAIEAGLSALAATPATSLDGIEGKIEIAAFLLEPEDIEAASLLASVLSDISRWKKPK